MLGSSILMRRGKRVTTSMILEKNHWNLCIPDWSVKSEKSESGAGVAGLLWGRNTSALCPGIEMEQPLTVLTVILRTIITEQHFITFCYSQIVASRSTKTSPYAQSSAPAGENMSWDTRGYSDILCVMVGLH